MKRILTALLTVGLFLTSGSSTLYAEEPFTEDTTTSETDQQTDQMFISLEDPDEINFEWANANNYDAEIEPLGIVGDDDRYQVKDPFATPNIQTVFIRSIYTSPTDGKNYAFTGSGCLVGKQTVLTAAHVLYNPKYGFVKSIQIYVGYSGSTYKATYTGKTAIVLPGYKKHADDVNGEIITPQGDDIGLITLKSSVDSKYGYVNTAATASTGQWFTTYGYPGDKLTYKQGVLTSVNQWGANGQIVNTNSAYYKITADILGGQSGSPLFNNKNEVFAVVSGGPKTPAVNNSATKVTNGTIELISSSESGYFPIYRIYNPKTGEHFYTAAYNEADSLTNLGWQAEGAAWSTGSTGVDVVRLYNPNTGEHHYTINTYEVDLLVKAGWKKEMKAWKAPSISNRPVYRLYNPNSTKFNHHYTVSITEKNALISSGWKDEGIAWYAY